MFLWAAHSDRTGERTMHTALPLAIAAIGLICTALVHSLIPMIVVLCVIVIAASMIKGPFWALATEIIPSRVAAPSIGSINALNNGGVFFATWVIGAIRSATGSFTYAILPIAAVSAVACFVALWLGRSHPAHRPTQALSSDQTTTMAS
jgi:ACS family tartrate transporter-like MFS transporter